MNDLIIKIEKKTRKVELEQIYIGNDNENLQENLVFMFDEFVNGQARLEYEIDEVINYIVLTKEEETYTLPVQNVLTIYQAKTIGKIKFQLVITEGTEEENVAVFKSNIFYLKCRPSINAVSEAPEGYDLWIEQANAILNEMDNIDIDITTIGDKSKVVITRKNGETKEADLLQDEDYVHTDNNYTTAEKNKLANLSNYDDTQVQQDIVDLKLNKAGKNEIPDVSNFITASVNNLVNYYLKSETYTQAEVNSLIGAVAGINIEIVQTFPTQDISTSTIYLIPKTASTNDNYDEYIYVSNNWEHIGSTEVDLTGYAKETWVNSQIANFLTQTQIEALINSSLGGKLDTNKVKNEASTTAGDVYDVRYINSIIGDIETLLSGI